MDQVSAETEKLTTYETSRTKRSLVEGTMHSDDSNNDEEFASSGFYVREKSSKKNPDTSKCPDNKSDTEVKDTSKGPDNKSDTEVKDTSKGPDNKSDTEVKENGTCSEDSVSSAPLLNGENSKDVEDSLADTKAEENDYISNRVSEDREDIEPEKEEINDVQSKTDESNTADRNNENTVCTGTPSKETDEPVSIHSNNDEQKNISSDSDNTDKPQSVEKEDDKNSEELKEAEQKEDEELKEAELKEAEDGEKGGNLEADQKENVEADQKENVEADQKENVEAPQKEVLEGGKKEDVEEERKVDTETEKKEDIIPEKEADEEKKKDVVLEEKGVVDSIQTEEVDKQEHVETEKDVVKTRSRKGTKPSNKEDSKCKQRRKGGKKGNKKVDQSGASILKEQLEKLSTTGENSEHDVEMDEDFDPSLLCPDISMDVDEAPVMTTTDHLSEDGSTSPLPYEPIFSTLVDEITGAEVQVDLTPEEMEMRQRMYGPNNPVQATKVHCTACNVHLGSALTGANNRFVHPLLKVLICKNCYHFYTSGEFEKDEDGSELYCRWCGQGGQVLCCSSCEFVFCKRCIRNNFGPKKFKEIRDSDDWNCFRCAPEQLSSLRASCAEFMEYYRTELGRAHSLADTNPELMTKDYTTCCSAPSEKKEETKAPVPSKTRRKRKGEDDPDYWPVLDRDEPPAKKPVPFPTSGYSIIQSTGLRPVVPKFTPPNTIRQVGSQPIRPQLNTSGQVFKVGSTTFRTKTPVVSGGFAIQRPPLPQGSRNNSGYITLPPSSAPKTTTPGYIKILPQRTNPPIRTPGSYTVVSGTNNGKPTFSTVRPTKPNQMPPMKHEWFEKTVRAAARVNSNLSYTLTQLNRQQSQASSVEALAMVHNKLQEVLSTSINSLIQIRKNLRTEFIAGIKNIKFPPKQSPLPPTTGPIVVKDDDDVIFVNPTTTSSQTQPPPLVLSPAVTLTKKTTAHIPSDPFSNPKPSTSGLKPNPVNKVVKPALTTTTPSTGPIKGGFLKVRSLTALQTVPSECITIPDDPPARRRPLEEDPLKIVDTDTIKIIETIEIDEDNPKPKRNKSKVPEPQSTEMKDEMKKLPQFNELMVYNVKQKPSPVIQKIMRAYVSLTRSPDLEERLRLQELANAWGNSASDRRKNVRDAKHYQSEVKASDIS